MNAPERTLRSILPRVLEAVDGLRCGRALWLLLATLAVAGLLLSMAQGSLGRSALPWAALQGGAAVFVTFYGTTATGLLLWDQANRRPPRDPADALAEALAVGHRLLLVLGGAMALVAAVAAAAAALLALGRLPTVGPWAFALAVPASVVALGFTALTMAGLVLPLAAPAVWAGLPAGAVLRLLVGQARHAWLATVFGAAAVSALAALTAALIGSLVYSGAQAVGVLALFTAGVELPPSEWLAGVFGAGWRTMAQAGSPVAATPLGAAALIGGGLVFLLGLALPALVYLRGLCSLFLALRPRDASPDDSRWTS